MQLVFRLICVVTNVNAILNEVFSLLRGFTLNPYVHEQSKYVFTARDIKGRQDPYQAQFSVHLLALNDQL